MPATQQRFDGPTLEAALEAAVRALGPDLHVVDARRIRTGGVAGFFSREQYEVIAGPGPAPKAAPAPGGSPDRSGAPSVPTVPPVRPGDAGTDEAALQATIDATIRALVEDVERRSDLVATPQFGEVLADAVARGGAEPVIDAEAETVVSEDDVRGDEAVETTNGCSVPVEQVGVERVDLEPVAEPALPVGERPSADEAAPVGAAPHWSRQALRRLGVPACIVNRLPTQRIGTDALWIAALTDAIAAEVPPPAQPGPEVDLCVSGYGAQAAVKILQAATQGFTPGTLWLDGEALPATPVVLALAVRACLSR